MTSELDRMQNIRYERERSSLSKAFSILEESERLSEAEMDAIYQNLERKKCNRPMTVAYLTRYAPYHFSDKTIHDITEHTDPQKFITYNQAVRLLDLVKVCVGEDDHRHWSLFARCRNMVKEVLLKYRQGITPKRDARGNPLISMPELRASVMIARHRAIKKNLKYAKSVEYIEYLMENYDYVVQSLMSEQRCEKE